LRREFSMGCDHYRTPNCLIAVAFRCWICFGVGVAVKIGSGMREVSQNE
jgi:hypothetical protein